MELDFERMEPDFDVIVVGAGLQGLVAARTFLELEPALKLVVVDSGAFVGGVWAEGKVYPGLNSDNLVGTYEYTDFPMDEKFGVKYPEHLPGEVIARYFHQYAEEHELMKRTELGAKVMMAEKTQEGWKLQLETASDKLGFLDAKEPGNFRLPAQRYITCSKLVVATGLTSAPRPLTIKGSNNFEATVIDFGDCAHKTRGICKNKSIYNVVVYGGGKASHDIVYMMATYGK